MINGEEIKGHWNEVKGRLKEHWGQLTDDDLQRVDGSTDQLIGVVQQKTGATKREVESFLNSVVGDGSFTQQASEAVQQYADVAQAAADDAVDYARENYERLAARSSDYGKKVAETVRSRPTESLALAFGVGIAAGALLFLGRKRS